MTAREALMHDRLLQMRAERILAAARHRSSIAVEREVDPLDDALALSAREVACAYTNGIAKAVAAINARLAQLEAGEALACEECEEPLTDKRLDAMPMARYCCRCQARMEAAA